MSSDGREPKVPQVQYRLTDESQMRPVLAVVDAPDTTGPQKADRTIRPSWVRLSMWAKGGVWEVSAAQVIGRSVRSGGAVTKHDYEVMFSDPLDSESEAPKWLREMCQEFTDRANRALVQPLTTLG